MKKTLFTAATLFISLTTLAGFDYSFQGNLVIKDNKKTIRLNNSQQLNPGQILIQYDNKPMMFGSSDLEIRQGKVKLELEIEKDRFSTDQDFMLFASDSNLDLDIQVRTSSPKEVSREEYIDQITCQKVIPTGVNPKTFQPILSLFYGTEVVQKVKIISEKMSKLSFLENGKEVASVEQKFNTTRYETVRSLKECYIDPALIVAKQLNDAARQ